MRACVSGLFMCMCARYVMSVCYAIVYGMLCVYVCTRVCTYGLQCTHVSMSGLYLLL